MNIQERWRSFTRWTSHTAWPWVKSHSKLLAVGVIVILLLLFGNDLKEKLSGLTDSTTVVEQPKDMTDSVKVSIVPTTIDTIALKERWERERVTADSLKAVLVTDTVFLAVQELSGPGGTVRYKAFELRNAKGEVVGYHNTPM